MELNEIKEHLRLHSMWLRGEAGGKKANLYGANLYGANLYGADLRGADLYGANLYGADLYSADLRGADLYSADLRGADLYGANLYGANLYSADLRGADLRGADLRGANLYSADLRGADLYSADLRGADLRGADLSNATTKETILEDKALLTFLYNRHTAYFTGDGKITIGCHTHSVSQWVTDFTRVGKENGYTDVEIEKYGKFIKGCAKIQAELDEDAKSKQTAEDKDETRTTQRT
jgi:hypothetical protein